MQKRTIRVVVKPPRAKVTIGKKRLPKSGRVEVVRGRSVKGLATARGYEDKPFTLHYNSKTPFVIELPAKPKAVLRFRVLPASARVWLDGRLIKHDGRTQTITTWAGKHTLKVKAGDKHKTRQVELKPGQTKDLPLMRLGTPE
jgi:hypothetical protein